MWINKQCKWTPSRIGDQVYFGPTRLVNGQRGVVVTEFIFSFLIAAGLSVVLFSLSYTLLVVETLQYVSFSVARAHLASNETPERQMEAGKKKYQALTQGDSAIANIFKSSWFQISPVDEIMFRQGLSAEGTGGANDFSQDLGGGTSNPNMRFQGISFRLVPKILNFNLPSLGGSNPENDDLAFETRINTMLIRESSQSECRQFFEKRKEVGAWRDAVEILNFPLAPEEFSIAEDNGC